MRYSTEVACMNSCKCALDHAEWLAYPEHGLNCIPRVNQLIHYSVNWNIHKSSGSRVSSQCPSRLKYLSRVIAFHLPYFQRLQRVNLTSPGKRAMPDILTAGEIHAITWTFTSVAVVITALRLYARIVIVKAFGLDDALILVGQVGIIPVISCLAIFYSRCR